MQCLGWRPTINTCHESLEAHKSVHMHTIITQKKSSYKRVYFTPTCKIKSMYIYGHTTHANMPYYSQPLAHFHANMYTTPHINHKWAYIHAIVYTRTNMYNTPYITHLHVQYALRTSQIGPRAHEMPTIRFTFTRAICHISLKNGPIYTRQYVQYDHYTSICTVCHNYSPRLKYAYHCHSKICK